VKSLGAYPYNGSKLDVPLSKLPCQHMLDKAGMFAGSEHLIHGFSNKKIIFVALTKVL
jgi:hypothetical protein